MIDTQQRINEAELIVTVRDSTLSAITLRKGRSGYFFTYQHTPGKPDLPGPSLSATQLNAFAHGILSRIETESDFGAEITWEE